MNNHSSHISHKHECLVALHMCFILATIYLFCIGETRASGGSAGITIYGAQARISLVLLAVIFIYPYLCKLQKKYWKTYKIFICGAIFMVLMYLGCFFFSWWSFFMSIPLTVLWYPFHYRILEGLPRKETDAGDDNSNDQVDS